MKQNQTSSVERASAVRGQISRVYVDRIGQC
jgi:hypothetical protein